MALRADGDTVAPPTTKRPEFGCPAIAAVFIDAGTSPRLGSAPAQVHSERFNACSSQPTDKAIFSKMGRIERTREIARRRKRRAKVKKLRKVFASAKTAPEKTEIQTKAQRVSPFVDLGETA